MKYSILTQFLSPNIGQNWTVFFPQIFGYKCQLRNKLQSSKGDECQMVGGGGGLADFLPGGGKLR